MDVLEKYQWKIIAAVILLLALGLLMAGVRPMVAETMKMHHEKKALHEKIAGAIEWEARLEQIEKERSAIETFFAGITVQAPNENLMSTLIERFFDIAKTSNVTIRRLLPLDPVDNETYLKIPFQLQVTGTYHNLARMIFRFEQLGYWLNPEKMEIKTGDEEIEHLQGSVTIHVFQIKVDDMEPLDDS